VAQPGRRHLIGVGDPDALRLITVWCAAPASTHGDQHGFVWCETGKKCCGREEGGPDHPGQADLRYMQVGLDRGKRDVDDGGVEHDHELAEIRTAGPTCLPVWVISSAGTR
jgi:hypothetical protein